MRLLDLFSGIGGFSLGLERTGGFETVAFCEVNPKCRHLLNHHWPEVPCFDDVNTLTGEQVGEIDAICGGFPCQDVSVGNVNGLGLDGSRSGLWREYHRLICETRPRVVFVENVANLLVRGIDRVLGDLADSGYDCWWRCIRASDVGAPHNRARVWIVAHARSAGRQGFEQIACALEREATALSQHDNPFARAWRALDGDFANLRTRDGVSVGVERTRLHQLGNAVVPEIPYRLGRAVLAALGEQRVAA
jgi:DNA (cytosine-5)-methyltransferase 1